MKTALLLVLLSSPKLDTLGGRSLIFAAPPLWNSLPPDLRAVMTLSVFKSKLKTFFV